jgi:hypothetical protein
LAHGTAGFLRQFWIFGERFTLLFISGEIGI